MSENSKFRYTVVTREQKTLSGIISAITMNQAVHNLQKLGYKLLSIVPVADKTVPKGKKIFSFEATNIKGQRILGTIATNSEEMARKRLEKEHGLIVLKLQEMSLQKNVPSGEKNVFEKEAKMVIEKAEALLRDITPYDQDYNSIFDAKEDIRYLLKMGDVRQLERKILETLPLLQQKEIGVVEERKATKETTVVKKTEDIIASIKMDAEKEQKHIGNVYFNAVLEEVGVLSGWLLAFYALYFFLAEVLTLHPFQLPLDLFLENTLLSTLLFKVALAVLLVHIYCRAKLYFFGKKLLSGILLGIVVALMIIWAFVLL